MLCQLGDRKLTNYSRSLIAMSSSASCLFQYVYVVTSLWRSWPSNFQPRATQLTRVQVERGLSVMPLLQDTNKPCLSYATPYSLCQVNGVVSTSASAWRQQAGGLEAGAINISVLRSRHCIYPVSKSLCTNKSMLIIHQQMAWKFAPLQNRSKTGRRNFAIVHHNAVYSQFVIASCMAC